MRGTEDLPLLSLPPSRHTITPNHSPKTAPPPSQASRVNPFILSEAEGPKILASHRHPSTDIPGANNVGVTSALVETGCGPVNFGSLQEADHPTYRL